MSQHRFGSRSWKDTNQSTFLGVIPYNAEYLALRKGKACKCKDSCECEFNWKGMTTDCQCMTHQFECLLNCKSCAKVREKGLNDNTQVQRLGLQPKATTRVWAGEIMGNSLVIQEDFKEGDALIGYVGNVIPRKQLPQDHKEHVLELHGWSFKLKKDCGEYKKGRAWKDDAWVMDCCEIGCNANYVNSTCVNNNATVYTTVVGRLPQPIVYAHTDGKSGLNVL